MEFIAATWWFWLGLAILSIISVGINWILVTYGTAIDIGSLAYKASQIKQEELPKTKEEFRGVALDVAKERALTYAKARAFSKVRKVFFGVIMLGLSVFSAGMFLVTLLIKAVLWVTAG